jgi:hypothetical protein
MVVPVESVGSLMLVEVASRARSALSPACGGEVEREHSAPHAALAPSLTLPGKRRRGRVARVARCAITPLHERSRGVTNLCMRQIGDE